MDRDKKDPGIIIKNLLCTIPMVNIKIYDGNFSNSACCFIRRSFIFLLYARFCLFAMSSEESVRFSFLFFSSVRVAESRGLKNGVGGLPKG